jgi:DNA-binding MarR family transcriptional regulator
MYLNDLASDDKPPTQKRIAEHLGLDKSSTHRLLQKMVTLDLIRISSCPNDARAKCVRLSDHGRKMASQVEASSELLFASLASALSEADRRAVWAAIPKLIEAIKSLDKGQS